MSRDLARAVHNAIEEEIWQQQRTSPDSAILTDDWQPRRGGWVVIPGGADPQANGARLIQMVNNRVRVNGHRLRADWNTNLPRHAVLTVRFRSHGNPQDLLEDPVTGVVSLNRQAQVPWPRALQGQIRFLSVHPEEGSQFRLARFEASSEVVRYIQENNGSMYIGGSRGTVQSNKKDVKKGMQVAYRLQK